MDSELRRSAIALYDRFTHEGMDRRLFMRRMVALAGSVAAAEALIGSISASPAAAALTDPADPRLIIKKGPLGFSSPRSGYVAVKQGTSHAPVVLVIHENRGLNAHIEDVARRFAEVQLAGVVCLCSRVESLLVVDRRAGIVFVSGTACHHAPSRCTRCAVRCRIGFAWSALHVAQLTSTRGEKRGWSQPSPSQAGHSACDGDGR